MSFRIVRCDLVEVPVDQDATCRELDRKVQEREASSDPLVAAIIRRAAGIEAQRLRLPAAEAAPPLFSPEVDFDVPRRVIWNPDRDES